MNIINKNSFKKKLFNIIESFIFDRISINKFNDKFYFYYVDNFEKNSLSKLEEDFFDEIHEKLDWTDLLNEPDKESRKYGWLNANEYKEFVKTLYFETFVNNKK